MRSSHEGYDRLDWVILVVHGRRGAREVVDPVDLEEDWLDHIVAEQLEPGVPEVVRDVLLPAGEEVVDHDHAVPLLQEPVHEVAPDEPCPAGNDDAARRRAEASGDTGAGGEGEERAGIWQVGGRGEREVGPEEEEGGGDERAEEDEEEALLAEDIPDPGARAGARRLGGLGSRRVRRRWRVGGGGLVELLHGGRARPGGAEAGAWLVTGLVWEVGRG